MILERHGCPLHYWLTGAASRPLIVCTHGAGADHPRLDVLIPAISDQFRTLAWDVRGHGQSRPLGNDFSIPIVVADLIAILDAIGNQEAIFVSQSMGRNIIQGVARGYPARAKALARVDCAGNTASLSWLEKK